MSSFVHRLRPINDEVLLCYLEPEEKQGLIYIPEISQRTVNPFTKGVVLAVGPKVYDIKKGDIVYAYMHRSGQKIDDNIYTIKQDFILAKEER